ncbi:uncharacterized protein DS421_15g508780 [Arachis hypogaea]|nr:uncharacterized protein DS421_15g508780 [Arachis hypogaea]
MKVFQRGPATISDHSRTFMNPRAHHRSPTLPVTAWVWDSDHDLVLTRSHHAMPTLAERREPKQQGKQKLQRALDNREFDLSSPVPVKLASGDISLNTSISIQNLKYYGGCVYCLGYFLFEVAK